MNYQQSYPRAKKDSYSDNDQVDWLLKIDDNTEIVKGSIQLAGTLKMRATNAPIKWNDDCEFDHRAGIHNFIDDIVTQFGGNGVSENITDYSRWVTMNTIGSVTSEDLATQTNHFRQLKCGDDRMSTQLLVGEHGSNTMPFCAPLLIGLNRSNRNFSRQDVEQFVLSLRWKPVAKCTKGALVNRSYTVENLRLIYKVQPKGSHEGPLTMSFVSTTRHTLNSGNSNVEIVLPSPASSISHTLCRTASLSSNDTAIENPAVTKVNYSFNNTNNQLVSFDLNIQEEILKNYLNSLNPDGMKHDIRPSNVDSTFGLGMNFDGNIYPAGTKVSMMLESDADSNNQISLFSYYNAILKV